MSWSFGRLLRAVSTWGPLRLFSLGGVIVQCGEGSKLLVEHEKEDVDAQVSEKV